MAQFVYILQSDVNGRFYIGSTDNPERRLMEHNSGNTRSTKPYRPWKLVFKHEFEDHHSGNVAERKLKSLKSRRILQNIVDGTMTIDEIMKWK